MKNWIQNLKVSAKLFLIAMLAVFVTLLLGILSFALMWQMESISTTMSEQWMTAEPPKLTSSTIV